MPKRLLLLVAMAIILASRLATADVLFTETLTEKVGASQTLAVAAFVKAEGTPPYDNANPPTAVFRVTQAIRGCKSGDLLRVLDWEKRPQPEGHHKSPMPATPPSAEELQQWAHAPVPLPPVGTAYILLLGPNEQTPGPQDQVRLSGHIPFPNHISADPGQVALVMGLATFAVEVRPENEMRLDASVPVKLVITVHNGGKTKAQFDMASLQLTLSGPKGGILDAARPTGVTPPVLDLAADESRSVDVDLGQWYPGAFTEPGDYWLQLQLPAQGGERLQRHLKRTQPSLAYICGRANQVLRARTKVEAGQATLSDPVYLRQRGEKIAAQIAWTLPAPLPAGERWLLCAMDDRLTYAVRDTAEARRQAGDAVRDDPPEWWSHDEERDPRFAVIDGPGSEQKRMGLELRLKELP